MKKSALLATIIFLAVITPKTYAQVGATNRNSATAPLPEVTNSSNSQSSEASEKLKQQQLLIQEQKKTTVQTRTEAVKQAKEQFKAKLELIKDQKKRSVVERIDTKINNINTKVTAHLTEAINTLQAFLDKIKQNAGGPAMAPSITTAQITLDKVKAAVETQAAKIYSMTITDDQSLRANAGSLVSQFRSDLSTLHKIVIEAKQIIQKLNAEINALRKEARVQTIEENKNSGASISAE